MCIRGCNFWPIRYTTCFFNSICILLMVKYPINFNKIQSLKHKILSGNYIYLAILRSIRGCNFYTDGHIIPNPACILLMGMYLINLKEINSFKLKLLGGKFSKCTYNSFALSSDIPLFQQEKLFLSTKSTHMHLVYESKTLFFRLFS